jgi:hypothetical protein
MNQMNQLKILSFAIDIQAYMKLRSSENDNTNSIFGWYNKTEKLDASNKLLRLLEGENIVLSGSDISIIRNGRLGDLCRAFAKNNGFATLRDFLNSAELKQYTKENISSKLTVDVDDHAKYLSSQIKHGQYATRDKFYIESKKILKDIPLMARIDGLLDLCIGFCKEQVSDKIFTDTPFKDWEFVETYATPPVMEFKVLGNFYYISNRAPSRGELRAQNFLDMIKNYPNLTISTALYDHPFDFICIMAHAQQANIDLAGKMTSSSNRILKESIFKKYYGY